MEEMGSTEQAIWNRAVSLQGKLGLGPGDTALSALLLAHGEIMNGGVLNCCTDALSKDELQAAEDGYRHFGLSKVADLFREAELVAEAQADEVEARLDMEYSRLVPDDNSLFRRLETKFQEDPAQFGRLD